MHVRKDTLRIEEVFPSFPAAAAGVKPGCEILEIAASSVWPGTWLEVFQGMALPFPLRLSCGKTIDNSLGGTGPLSDNPELYRVMVIKKPYGMNVQTNVVPRVVGVLPGFPAEAAGVRKGMVLTAVGDQAVDSSNWFEKFETTKMPFTLTFNTTVPLHEGNQFFTQGEDGKLEDKAQPSDASSPGSQSEIPLADTPEGNPLSDLFEDFRAEVDKLPFGMQVTGARPGVWPRVVGTVEGLNARSAGIHVGDVLVEVAGRPVGPTTWFAAMQQARTPYGIRFRRPKAGARAEPSI